MSAVLPASKLDLRVPVWVTAIAFLREGTPMRRAEDNGEKASAKKKAAGSSGHNHEIYATKKTMG